MADAAAKKHGLFHGLVSWQDIKQRVHSMFTTAPTADFVAGLTLWGMIVPESIAYAALTGAPPQAGVYAIIVLLPIYALFASSNFLVATSTSAVSATTAGFLAIMASDVVPSLAAIVVAVGLIYMLFAIFRLGFLADFISEPVNRGFIYGLSIFIVVSQLPKILGIESVHGSAIDRIIGIFQNLDQIHIPTLILGLSMLGLLVMLPKLNRKMPSGLMVTIFAMIISYAFNLESQYEIKMVGALPQGLPKFVVPNINLSDMATVIIAGIGIAILGMSESTAVGETIAAKKEEKLNINQQLFAFGIGNFVSGFFGGIANTGSMSSTAVNMGAGARTLLSTIVASLAAVVTVLFLFGIFVYLPEAFLGALIIHAVINNLRVRKITDIHTYSHGEFWIAILAAGGVICFDVLPGLLLAMLMNLIYFAYIATKVRIEPFGNMKGETYALAPMALRDVVAPPDGVLVLGMVRGSVYYADIRKIVESLTKIIHEARHNDPKIHSVVFVGDRVDTIHFTSVEILKNFEKVLKDHQLRLYITNMRDQKFVDKFNQAGFNSDFINFSTELDLKTLPLKPVS